jgi:hypothetical protein
MRGLRLCALVVALGLTASCDHTGPAGSISAILNPAGLIDDNPAGAGDAIPSGATLSTDSRGVVEFLLRRSPAACQLRPRSRVVIAPGGGATLRYEEGAVWCQIAEEGEREVVIDARSGRLRVTEARFGLRQKGNGEELVVESGLVAVSDDPAGEPGATAPPPAARRVVKGNETLDMRIPSASPQPFTPQTLSPGERTILDTVGEPMGSDAPSPGQPSETSHGTPSPDASPGDTGPETTRPVTTPEAEVELLDGDG